MKAEYRGTPRGSDHEEHYSIERKTREKILRVIKIVHPRTDLADWVFSEVEDENQETH